MEMFLYWAPIIFGLLVIVSALIGYAMFQVGCNCGFNQGYYCAKADVLDKLYPEDTTQPLSTEVDIRDLWNEELDKEEDE